MKAGQQEGLAPIWKDNRPLDRAHLLKGQLRLVFQLSLAVGDPPPQGQETRL